MILCKRQFTDAELDEADEVLGVYGEPLCTICRQPSALHGTSVGERALWWALGNDTGISSETLARHMLGHRNSGRYASPPSDSDDRGRCIRLLELIPEWLPRIEELIVGDRPSTGMVIDSKGMRNDTNSWQKQIPLILQEGGFEL